MLNNEVFPPLLEGSQPSKPEDSLEMSSSSEQDASENEDKASHCESANSLHFPSKHPNPDPPVYNDSQFILLDMSEHQTSHSTTLQQPCFFTHLPKCQTSFNQLSSSSLSTPSHHPFCPTFTPSLNLISYRNTIRKKKKNNKTWMLWNRCKFMYV